MLATVIAFVVAATAVTAPVGGNVPAPPGSTTAGSLPPLASLSAVRAAIQAPGARAVLVNVWATWCDSCRNELPDILRFYRQNRARGLRLVMVSADDADQRAEVGRVLDQALAAATISAPSGVVSLVKQEDDTVFVNGIDRKWSGALPATFLFDRRGERKKSWLAPVTRDELEAGARELLTTGASELKPKSQPKVEATPDRRIP